jgi:glutaminyl-peptide cyclotransferase
LRAAWQSASVALVVQCSPTDPSMLACREPTPLRFDIVAKITRSGVGFTQGLEVHDDGLYESTGRISGTTRLNLISLDGKVARLADLGTTVFGEGLTILKDEIFQLTWQEHEVFVYDRAGKLKREMHNPRDGWGLTNDGTDLIFSDGGPSFYYADPRTFAIRKSVRVRTNRPGNVEGLNELELVGGKLFGNIFTTRSVVRLDPASGCIDGIADLSVLWKAMTPEERAASHTPESFEGLHDLHRSYPSPSPLACPPHRWAVWVLDLNPITGRPGMVGRGEPLRHDALEPELAGVPEHHGALLVGVLVEHNAGRRPRQ